MWTNLLTILQTSEISYLIQAQCCKGAGRGPVQLFVCSVGHMLRLPIVHMIPRQRMCALMLELRCIGGFCCIGGLRSRFSFTSSWADKGRAISTLARMQRLRGDSLLLSG